MKKFFVAVLALVLLFTVQLEAQISVGGTPFAKSAGLSADIVPEFELDAFDLERITAEDLADEKAGNYPKIARLLPIGVALTQTNHWEELPGGDRVWRMKISSDNAKALSVQFEDFYLPRGSKLFIYTPNYSHVIGGFTTMNNHPSGVFSTELVIGDEVIVEYYEPASVSGEGNFTIIGAFHAYRMIPEAEGDSLGRDFGDSDPCQVNANCSEGNNWQDQKRGVVRIFVVEGFMGGWCSGSLINNTAQDCRPFLLTALHCGQNASSGNMNQWVFYFNYEASGCSNPFSQGNLANQSMTGCTRRADSGDNGGNQGSDYMLVELNNNVPQSYNPYFNGWRRNNVTSSSGVSIHHPAGDIKKISTYTNSLSTTSWGSANGSHWQVTWSATTNGHGVTEGGSSGSPIFDNNGLIIGTLTGGSSFCSTPFFPDLYGKMSYHWNSNPGDNLSVWLDPVGSNLTSLTGTNAPCGGGGTPGGCEANIPFPENDPCVQLVIAEDPFCCDDTWDDICQDAYQECLDASIPDCEANIPYPLNDPCVQTVLAEDPFCCEDTWDDICEDAYQDCSGGGGSNDCEAGTVAAPTSQSVCPGELAIFNANGVATPPGGGYALGFAPNGGTGGVADGFTLTGVELPFEFNSGLNGILAANSLPALAGQWTVIGVAYSNEDNIEGSICGTTSNQLNVNFLAASHPDCQGSGGGCPSGEVEDCNGNCAPIEWIGDGYCDDGTYAWNGVPIYFDCAQFNNDEGDCNETSVGQLMMKPGSFALYPNPANSIVTLSYIAGQGENLEISILSAHGSYVYRANEFVSGEYVKVFDVSNFASGVYFVRIHGSKGIVTKKLMVSGR